MTITKFYHLYVLAYDFARRSCGAMKVFCGGDGMVGLRKDSLF